MAHVAVAITGTDRIAAQRLVRLLREHGLAAATGYEWGAGWHVAVSIEEAQVARAVLLEFAPLDALEGSKA